MSEIMTEGKKAKLIDETVYNYPYVVKSNCLYEMVQVKDQVVPMKLADFVPTLISEITRDDGTEQKKMFKFTSRELNCRSRLFPQTKCKT
ncbi:hypothetical protein [uncultured Ruminococcus sp.]|uniref:hypothetical protein n=1 Tax=uncultured Ruminococcus sp. TaxID=165186 RepID=UPI0025E81594|nr:hypothetical protein [uncultured Ruminococcus sp.]